jgi:dihydrolipoamide dehydrogenase
MAELSEVRVPDIGDFTDVPVIEIHVSPGDEISPEDPLVTLESDKATMDVPAPFAGTVKQLRVKIGDRVSEGSVLLALEPGPDGASGTSSAAVEELPREQDAPAEEQPERGEAVSVKREPAPPEGDGTESERDAQVVVLGSGPGGYSAAFRAADLGLKTIMVERYETLGGVCLNVGCIPSKALLHAARVIAEAEEMSAHGVSFGKPEIELEPLLSWKEQVVGKLTGGLKGLARQRKVDVVTGTGELTGPHTLKVGDRELGFENCIIAAGSEAAWLPDLPEDPRIVSSTGALSPGGIPKRMLVIGGGIIGLEMATVYDALGSKVNVVELLEQLLPECDGDLVRPLQKRISARYEAIRLGTKVVEVKAQKSGLKVSFSDDSSEVFELVLVAVGRRPNGKAIGAEAAGVSVDDRGFVPVDAQMRTNVSNIYAIGDITGPPMLAHKAFHQGKVAAEVIAGERGAAFDARTVPSVAYTDPEVAWMGLTENEARKQEIELEKFVFPWAASGRALGLAREEGMTKLLFEPGSKRLLGAGIVGINAGELIAETVHALEMGANAEDIALSIHPHPTLSETVGLAAEMAQGTITDLMPPRGARSRH